MSSAVKSMQDAVQDEINAFVANGCVFTAFSITQNLRMKVNTGALEVDGLPFLTIGGSSTQKIEHDSIRGVVHQICGFNNVAGYERHFVSDPNARGGGYYEWGPSQQTIQTIGGSTGTSGAMQVGTVTQTNAPLVVSTAKVLYLPADPTDPIVVGKILNYFNKRLSLGVPATLHSTQRRLKRSPLTIDEIKIIAVSNNYVVEPIAGKPDSEALIKAGKQSFVAGTVGSGKFV